MHTLPKHEPTDSLNHLCEIFVPHFFLYIFILPTLDFLLYTLDYIPH